MKETTMNVMWSDISAHQSLSSFMSSTLLSRIYTIAIVDNKIINYFFLPRLGIIFITVCCVPLCHRRYQATFYMLCRFFILII